MDTSIGLSSSIPGITNSFTCATGDDDDDDEEARLDALNMDKKLDENLKNRFDGLSEDEEDEEEDDEENEVDEESRIYRNSDDHIEGRTRNGLYRAKRLEGFSSHLTDEHDIQPNESNHHALLESKEDGYLTEGLTIERSLNMDTEVSQYSREHQLPQYRQHIHDIDHSVSHIEQHSILSDNEDSQHSDREVSQYSDKGTSHHSYTHHSDKEVSQYSDKETSHHSYTHHSDTEASRHSDTGVSHVLDVDVSHHSDTEVSRHSDTGGSRHSHTGGSRHSDTGGSHHSDKHVHHFHSGDNLGRTESEFSSTNKTEYISDNHYKNSVHSDNPMNSYSYKSEENIPLSKYNELLDKFNLLDTLHKGCGKYMEDLTKLKKSSKEEMNILQSKLKSNLEEIQIYLSKVQELETSIQRYIHENNILKGNLKAVEHQASAERKAKENALSEVESLNATIQSLEKQINDLSQFQSVRSMKDQYDRNERELKQRHKKEVLDLKTEISNLKEKLKAKDIELDAKMSDISKYEQKFEAFKLEKNEVINKLSDQLEVSQKQNQNLLQAGTMQESAMFQIHHLEQEKKHLEAKISDLKDEIRSLKEQFRTNETKVKQLEYDSGNKNAQNDETDGSSASQLQRLMKSLKSKNHSLEKILEEIKKKLSESEETVKILKSQKNEYHSRAMKLEKKLKEVLPSGSISINQHEKEVNSLKSKLMESQKKLNEIEEKLKSTLASLKELQSENEKLKKEIGEMSEKQKSGKMEVSEMLRKECLEEYEAALENEKKKLKLSADEELERVHGEYRKQLKELKNEIQHLTEVSEDAKSRYIKVVEDNKLLETKLDSLSKVKGLDEFKRGLQQMNEKKINEIKLDLSRKYEWDFKQSKEDWVKQKVVEYENYVKGIEQQYDDKFHKCVDEEKKDLQSKYEEKVNSLKQQYAEEKSLFQAKTREFSSEEWVKREEKLQQCHKNEVESMKQKYKDQISALETEIKTLKETISQKSDDVSQEIKNLKQEISKQKEIWNDEKSKLVYHGQKLERKLSSLLESKSNLLEKIEEKRKQLHLYKKKYEEKNDHFRKKNEELQKAIADKETEIVLLKEEYDSNKTKQKFQKLLSVKNSQCQTEERLIPMTILMNVLKITQDHINTFVQNFRKCHFEQLQKALHFYHSHLMSKLKESGSLSTNLYQPSRNVNFPSTGFSHNNWVSPKNLQNKFISNLKCPNSTPIDSLASADAYKKLGTHMSEITKVKTLYDARSMADSPLKIQDISTDFAPLNVQNKPYTSTKLPEFSLTRGLFSRQNILNGFTERDPVIN